MGPRGSHPPIFFLISVLKVGGLARTSPAMASRHLRVPPFSTKGAIRTCGADFLLRMRLPPQARARMSVCAWGPGPSLAFSRAWDLEFAAEAELTRTRVQGPDARPPPFSCGVVGHDMMGLRPRGDRPPSQAAASSWQFAGRRKPGHGS